VDRHDSQWRFLLDERFDVRSPGAETRGHLRDSVGAIVARRDVGHAGDTLVAEYERGHVRKAAQNAAEMAEYPSCAENPRVGGSIPSQATNLRARQRLTGPEASSASRPETVAPFEADNMWREDVL
jgi:hypothetical protein